jgi:UDP-N-acetylmuramoyl-tripeptide--D-alanyl-D-alanine ligase
MKIEELYQLYLQYPSVKTDTRKLEKNDLYFALKGPNFNGNEFALKALESGAAKAIIDDARFEVKDKTILVDDVLTTLQQLANYHRKQFKIPFLAITGSNGKTTTKELIHRVLSSQFKTYTTEGNLNNHIGVPLTILKIQKDAELVVLEMGANHIGEIASYCRIADPTHGLITNCGKAHLEGFGSEEGVRKGKGELFDHLRTNNGTAFVMWDYEYLRDMSKGIHEIFTYGTTAAKVTGKITKTEPFLELKFDTGLTNHIKTNLVGGYNLPNVLAAAAVGLYFSVSADNIKKSIESYQPSNSRSQLIIKEDKRIILDAYNANPSSMKVAIDNFSKAAGNNKFLILGAMAELGNSSILEHNDIIKEINKHKWKEVLLVGNEFSKVDHQYKHFPSSDEAGNWLKGQNLKDAFILVKGSRSMQMEKVLAYL